MKFSLGYNMKINLWWGGGDKNFLGGVYWCRRGFFQVKGVLVNFWLVVGRLIGKTLTYLLF